MGIEPTYRNRIATHKFEDQKSHQTLCASGYGLDREIREMGWTLFNLAEIKASVFGFDREKASRAALNRVLAKAKSDKFNALEVSHVAVKRFLGLDSATVSAHARHLQESMFLLHDKQLAKRNRGRLVYSRADRGGW